MGPVLGLDEVLYELRPLVTILVWTCVALVHVLKEACASPLVGRSGLQFRLAGYGLSPSRGGSSVLAWASSPGPGVLGRFSHFALPRVGRFLRRLAGGLII